MIPLQRQGPVELFYRFPDNAFRCCEKCQFWSLLVVSTQQVFWTRKCSQLRRHFVQRMLVSKIIHVVGCHFQRWMILSRMVFEKRLAKPFKQQMRRPESGEQNLVVALVSWVGLKSCLISKSEEPTQVPH